MSQRHPGALFRLINLRTLRGGGPACARAGRPRQSPGAHARLAVPRRGAALMPYTGSFGNTPTHCMARRAIGQVAELAAVLPWCER